VDRGGCFLLISFFGFVGFVHLLWGVSGRDTFFLVDYIFSPTQFCFAVFPSSTKLLDFLAFCTLNTLLFVDFLAYSSVLVLLPWFLCWYLLVFVGCKGWVRMGITFAFSDGKNSWA
jgi:hypothetical protein